MDLITRKTRIRRQGDLILQTGGQAMNLAIKESYGFFQSPLNQTLVKTRAKRDSRPKLRGDPHNADGNIP
jgi:hypothetical protein